MWPLPGEGLDRVLAAETAVELLYARALTEWAPAARAAALPRFHTAVTAAVGDDLPVDAAAVEQESGWGPLAESIVVAGVGVLFAAATVEALKGLASAAAAPLVAGYPALRRLFPQESAGKPLVAPRSGGPSAVDDLGKPADGRAPDDRRQPLQEPPQPPTPVNPQENAGKPLVAQQREEAVLAIVNRAAPELDADQLREAARLVDETPNLAAARDQVVAAQRAATARIPAALSHKIEMAVRDTPPDETGVVSMAAQRTAAAAVLDPQGDTLADLASASWHESAAVQNRAVLAVAELDDDRDQLQKVWIATLDAATRPTHWAADGSRVDLDAPFTVGGEPLMFPADPAGSPAETYSCRCRMGIIGKDEPLPDEVDRHTERLNGRDNVSVRRGGRSQAEEIRRRTADGNTRARDNPNGAGTVAAAAPNEGDDMHDDDETFLTFTDALFAVTGVPTDDRRMLHADIELSIRDCPLPLQWQERTGEGHKGSVTVGVIEAMRVKDGEVRGDGYMLNSENAAKALDLIQHGVCKPSIDMADATAVLTFADGTEVTEQNFNPDTPVFEAYKKGTITAATIVAIPAFGQTGLSLNTEREPRLSAASTEEAVLVASAHTQPVYDPALFAEADPNLLHPMRLTMDPDTGRVFGFIATWKDQHRSVGLGNIRPPRSATSYEHFHTSPGVHLSDGRILPVGRLTVGIGHAPTRGVSAAAAQSHYDNVSACWALGRVSEHRLGIFFSGVVAPWATPEKVQMGLHSPVSGDWRPIGPNRNMELVAVLSVNTPGFLCKVETDESGAPAAMVASMGVVDEVGVEQAASLSLDDVRSVMRDVLEEREADAARAARLASAAARAFDLLGEPLTPTERIAEGLAELAATEVDEFGIKKVRDANYWGMPVGTPIKKGMKPRGKTRGGAKNSPSTVAKAEKREVGRKENQEALRSMNRGANSDVARQQRGADAQTRTAAAKADAEKRHAKTAERTLWESKLLSGGKDHAEREVADLQDKITQLDRQIAENRRNNRGVDEIVKRKNELQDRLRLAQKAAGKKA